MHENHASELLPLGTKVTSANASWRGTGIVVGWCFMGHPDNPDTWTAYAVEYRGENGVRVDLFGKSALFW